MFVSFLTSPYTVVNVKGAQYLCLLWLSLHRLFSMLTSAKSASSIGVDFTRNNLYQSEKQIYLVLNDQCKLSLWPVYNRIVSRKKLTNHRQITEEYSTVIGQFLTI